MNRPFLISLFIVFLVACKQENKPFSAQEIIDKSMLASGTAIVGNSKIAFDFRNRQYEATRSKGRFHLERRTKSSTGETKDILSNNGFERYLDDALIVVPDSMTTRYSGSVNSVHYFATLPYGLNDGAVQKKLLKKATIKGKTYHKVEIRFSEEGGGEDFDDVFVYWIDTVSFHIDYLAYTFHVNGGGKRFRAAKNARSIQGIRFVDYDNYKPTDVNVQLKNLDTAFENSALEKISEIALNNISVTPFTD